MIKKAVVGAAGYGTRFFPVAKTVNKCMLPVLRHPLVHLAVEDCVIGGIEKIAVVTRPGDTQIRRYFGDDPVLRRSLETMAGPDRYEPIANLHRMADFTFLEQPDNGRYGSAIPAVVAREFVGTDDFLLIAADDVILRWDGGSEAGDLAACFHDSGRSVAISAAIVPGRTAGAQGVLRTRRQGERLHLTGIIEKPAGYAAPQARVFIGRAALPAAFLDRLDTLAPDERSGEYQITSAIEALARESLVAVHETRGSYYNCGDVPGWLSANLAAARMADVELE